RGAGSSSGSTSRKESCARRSDSTAAAIPRIRRGRASSSWSPGSSATASPWSPPSWPTTTWTSTTWRPPPLDDGLSLSCPDRLGWYFNGCRSPITAQGDRRAEGTDRGDQPAGKAARARGPAHPRGRARRYPHQEHRRGHLRLRSALLAY